MRLSILSQLRALRGGCQNGAKLWRRLKTRRLRWLAPDHRYFKLRVQDGATYILRHDVISAAWELVLFDH